MKKKSLPLLDFVSSNYKDVKLDKVLLIASQHILESQRLMFEYFIEKGLKPKNIFLIGKCYSTNRDVIKRFQKMGIYVSPKSESFDQNLSFDEQFEGYTRELLDYINKVVNLKNYDRVIILEDGGSLLSYANRILKDTRNIIGIEQTSAGYEKLKNIKLDFPVINVARSYAKLKVESPIIAKTCIERLKSSLSRLKLKPKSILIIGAGAVGNAIYEELNSNFLVKRYDLDSNLSDYKNESLKAILGEFDMIIGSTGKEIIDISLYKYLKDDAILVSVSSSDREFSAVNLRKMIDKKITCHDDLKVKSWYLLNGGFPINFDGAEDSASSEKIQITLALLFASLCLAVKQNYRKGLIDLEKNTQNQIIDEFGKL
ncbi:hypothetical protein J4438_01810 [Candidatus Woesearchaeota archaeon]|nr:hypothetical protein [Candidatus Woesearchaeota archaeon]